ncbi:B12-binding domain-containing radical SAM protein [Desulfuribacillus alkaliarsenatis]|uniref:Uncharacterized protein n=1 Tax=Desulfuribacillus alkaliarsenatis TaxID=766136 RepID=A0A1E5G596_9FIRM|nr:radical SAM protein [Desulfuribacillus alkaliarsenatis]OEF98367.1 hypothetical protein BHF68_01435 [Desulfuribacillus alkaliarsenatis]
MRVLLVKCHRKTLFSHFEPIVTEPLELEYLSSLLTELDIEHRIYDALLEGGTFQSIVHQYNPDVVALSGYVTAVGTILDNARFIKALNRDIKVIVGGVHAEINYQDFFIDSIDYIVHSNQINAFAELIKTAFSKDTAHQIGGIAFHNGQQWQVNEKKQTDLSCLALPNRAYLETYKQKTKYMQYSPVALVQTAMSCPFKCKFCYCRLLNMGEYTTRNMQSVIEEIKEINTDYIWIVDDSFLLERQRILEFIAEVKAQNTNKKFIAYTRVDFIANNEDIIAKLAEIGFIELIVGIEAVDDQSLQTMNKQCSANQNMQATKIASKYNIRITALFIVGIDFTFKDFRRLRCWIRASNLDSYALSIFTPLKGTALYQEYKEQIIDHKHESNDFLHAIIKPTNMPTILFYINFYMLYVEQFFRSRHIRGLLWSSFNPWR